MAGEDQFQEMTKAHQSMWDGFTSFMVWSGVAIVLILILMAVFLV